VPTVRAVVENREQAVVQYQSTSLATKNRGENKKRVAMKDNWSKPLRRSRVLCIVFFKTIPTYVL